MIVNVDDFADNNLIWGYASRRVESNSMKLDCGWKQTKLGQIKHFVLAPVEQALALGTNPMSNLAFGPTWPDQLIDWSFQSLVWLKGLSA